MHPMREAVIGNDIGCLKNDKVSAVITLPRRNFSLVPELHICYKRGMKTVDDETTKAVLAENLQGLLSALGWSQQDLADACGEDKMTISRILRGKHMPGLGVVTRISSAVGVSVDDLLKIPKKTRQTA